MEEAHGMLQNTTDAVSVIVTLSLLITLSVIVALWLLITLSASVSLGVTIPSAYSDTRVPSP